MSQTLPELTQARKMSDLRKYKVQDRIDRLEQNDNYIRISWKSGRNTECYYSWLRENCACEDCRHPSTMERTIDILCIPEDIQPEKISISPCGDLEITWPDGHRSVFDPGWLWAHMRGSEAEASEGKPSGCWELGPDSAIPTLRYGEYMSDDKALLSLLDILLSQGVALIENVPTNLDEVVSAAQRISFLRNTHYGYVFDVRSTPNPISGAYTSRKLDPHTDLPNFELPPGFQFFHCLTNNAKGGETVLVDGFRVAQALRTQAPDLFQILAHYPLRFRLLDHEGDRTYAGCVIGLDHDSEMHLIRYSRACLAPYTGPLELYPQIRRAYFAFSKLVNDPMYRKVIKLMPGQLLITANYRILHGREAFNLETGTRHLQGCYLDRTEVLSRKEVLQRDTADPLMPTS